MSKPILTPARDNLSSLYERLGLTRNAILVVEAVRKSAPARDVRNGRSNVSSRYPSRKMGNTVQAESHRLELAAVYAMEHDQAVLEFYDQPPPFPITYPTKNGGRATFLYTADYFVIRSDGIGWEEWKYESELEKLAEKMPHRYLKDERGVWLCPPATRYAGTYGLSFKVRTEREINWVKQRNLYFLEDYLHLSLATDDPHAQAIAALVEELPGTTLAELLAEIGPKGTDTLYQMIAHHQVYVNLERDPIAEPEQVQVYRDEAQAMLYVQSANDPYSAAALNRRPLTGHKVNVDVGAVLAWDGIIWTVINAGSTSLTLRNSFGSLIDLSLAELTALVRQGKIAGVAEQADDESNAQVRELLGHASPEDREEAAHRFRIIEPYLAGEKIPDMGAAGASKRTIYNWIKSYREAEAGYGSGFVGLLPHTASRGNRSHKLPMNTTELMDEFIAQEYETIKQKGVLTSYSQFVAQCLEQGLVAPSLKTFSLAVKARPHYEQVKSRMGRRAAYKYEPPYWTLSPTTPRHGDRPFEIAHLDHTELDIELVSARTGKNLGRPWATFLIDAYSRRLLAVYLTFDHPSYRSCMMTLRECVRQHSRLPQTIVVDGGPEFHSSYFEVFLARYEVTKKTRPPAQSRFGSVGERIFGTANTTFVHNLLGNTQITRNVRQVTKSVNPKEHAVWTLSRLYDRLCEWAYEVYDTTPHPALGQSPRDEFLQGMAKSGSRPARLIPYDQNFVMDTLPTTDKGEAKVQPRDGVKIAGIYYWADDFRHPEVEQKSVPVRYDPYDMGVAYAFVRGHWVQCISQYYSSFRGRSEREMQLATEELRRQHRQGSNHQQLTTTERANFLDSLEGEELLLKQRLRDTELGAVHSRIAGNLTEMRVPAPSTTNQPGSLSSSQAVQASDSAETEEPSSEGLPLALSVRRIDNKPRPQRKHTVYEDY